MPTTESYYSSALSNFESTSISEYTTSNNRKSHRCAEVGDNGLATTVMLDQA
jgi:hypothetical protein